MLGLARGLCGTLSLSLSCALAMAGESACVIDDHPFAVICGEVRLPSGALHYVRMPARARLPEADPVLLLDGSATRSHGVLASVLARARNRRDLLIVSSAACAPAIDAGDVRPTGPQRACLGGATVADAHGVARAVLALLDARGIKRVNLVSSGVDTRDALAFVAQYPQRVRSAVFDAVLPPDRSLIHDAGTALSGALEVWLDACADQPGCDAAATRRDIERLAGAQPRGSWVHGLRRALLHPETSALLGPALRAAVAGDEAMLRALDASALRDRELSAPERLCGEDAHIGGGQARTRFDAALRDDALSACAGVARTQALPPLTAVDFPVLLFSGGGDPLLPPAYGAAVRDALGAQARHLVAPGGGHVQLGRGCVADLLHRFIDGGFAQLDAAPGTACLEQVPWPRMRARQ